MELSKDGGRVPGGMNEVSETGEYVSLGPASTSANGEAGDRRVDNRMGVGKVFRNR